MTTADIQQPQLAKHDPTILDLAFAMDCTGSMSSYIHNAQENIRKIVEEIVAAEKSDIHLALVEYRDHPPQDKTFVTRTHDFTPSVKTMKGWLDGCSAKGGGDEAEAVADALHDVLKLNWREEATKICILISDAPPHGLTKRAGDEFPKGCPRKIDPMAVVRSMAQKGITLYSVGCEPSINPYKDFFSGIAYITGGQYVPLAGAKSLTQVIIGGAQEEISLEKWMEDVNKEVMAEMEAKGSADIDEEAMCLRVQDVLKSKGARSKQLQRNNAKLEAPTSFAQKMSGFSKLSDVNAVYDKQAPSAACHPSRLLMSAPSGSKKKKKRGGFLNGIFSKAASRSAADEDDDCEYDGAPCPPPMASMNAMSAEEECYNVADGDVDMVQARRMVQKSKMRNMSKFS